MLERPLTDEEKAWITPEGVHRMAKTLNKIGTSVCGLCMLGIDDIEGLNRHLTKGQPWGPTVASRVAWLRWWKGFLTAMQTMVDKTLKELEAAEAARK